MVVWIKCIYHEYVELHAEAYISAVFLPFTIAERGSELLL